jgi:hypothetical protein
MESFGYGTSITEEIDNAPMDINIIYVDWTVIQGAHHMTKWACTRRQQRQDTYVEDIFPPELEKRIFDLEIFQRQQWVSTTHDEADISMMKDVSL